MSSTPLALRTHPFHPPRYVSLSLNYFSGALPSSFASDAITHFDVADAGFEGAVPAEMGEWTSLTFLDLSRNKVRGRKKRKWGEGGRGQATTGGSSRKPCLGTRFARRSGSPFRY
jgi:hypothetical protein